MNQHANEQYEQACDAALSWVARLRSDDVSEQDRQSFALWLGEDPCHATAMDDALDLWDDLGVVRHMPASAELPKEAANQPRWLMTAVAAAACLVLAIVLWPQLQSDPVSSQYRSAMGERLEVELPDGSRALLNTDSLISVTYSDDERLIELERGEAWFQVVSNKEMPFHVDAGKARITAVGTAFNVYRSNDGTEVAVTEGVVRVTELGTAPGRDPAAKVLRINQQLLASPEGWEVSTAQDLDQQLAWHQGQLVAREMPLPELVSELQRYSSKRILISDPELVNLTVSGVFELDKPQASLQAVALSLGIETRSLGDTAVRLLKAQQ